MPCSRASVAAGSVRSSRDCKPRRLHIYAKGAAIASALALCLNGVAFLLPWRFAPGALLGSMLALSLVLVCSLISVCLAVDAGVKHRWPGYTAYAHATRPGRRDLALAASAVVLTIVNLALLTRLLFLY